LAAIAFICLKFVAPFLRAKLSMRQKAHPGARKIAGRHLVFDVSIPFRMNTGSAGDVNRSHPNANIEPCLIDAAAPPTSYGQAVVGDVTSGGVRPLTVADNVTGAITGFVIATNVLTLTAANGFKVGQQVTLSAFGTSTY